MRNSYVRILTYIHMLYVRHIMESRRVEFLVLLSTKNVMDCTVPNWVLGYGQEVDQSLRAHLLL